MPLHTPLSGSWLNMAESLQRIVVGRALAGQHAQSAEELVGWLEDAVAGWNAAPTPFVWDGKRRERRVRARQRRLGGSAEPVNRFETPGAGNYRGSSCVSLVGFGGLIQAAVGSGG